jgi:hypothetical protein
MTKLTATTTPTDRTRCYRAMIAWLDGDLLGLDYVLEQAMHDPIGVPGLVFELLEVATSASEELDHDIRDHLRAALIQREQDS